MVLSLRNKVSSYIVRECQGGRQRFDCPGSSKRGCGGGAPNSQLQNGTTWQDWLSNGSDTLTSAQLSRYEYAYRGRRRTAPAPLPSSPGKGPVRPAPAP